MAALLQHRPRLLRGLAALLLALALAGPAAASRLLEAVLADVDGRLITASDVAVARRLGLFGLPPAAGPVTGAEAERLVDAWLMEAEASRLELAGGLEERAGAWREAEARAGGPQALAAWAGAAGLDLAWIRRLVEVDLAGRRFLELRFRRFVFVTNTEIVELLGPGPHPMEARERAQAALREERAGRALAAWLLGARREARIRRAALAPGGILLDLPAAPPRR